MARKRMVTRTLIGMKGNMLVMDLTECTSVTKEFVINGNFDDEATLLKKLQKEYNDETITVCKVLTFEKVEKLYGMEEALFFANAVELTEEQAKREEYKANRQ